MTNPESGFDFTAKFNRDVLRDIYKPLNAKPQPTPNSDTSIIQGISSDMIDTLFANTLSGLHTAATRAFWGINHMNHGLAVPANYDLHGYTFFTKPRMRLNDANCVQDRSLMYLLNQDPMTIPRAVRAYLDPLGSGSRIFGTSAKILKLIGNKPYRCPLVDPLSPFISILSNSLTSLTGWEDVNVETWTSSAGIMKEQYSMYDGTVKRYGKFSLNATFTNMRGDPIGFMFYIWLLYGSLVGTNENMFPYYDAIIDDEKDYETRIYRLVMDPTKTYVQKMAAANACIPTAANTGASFDYDISRPVNDRQDTHSISFECQGAIYYDPYLPVAFNTTVVDFNPSMFPGVRKNVMVKIPRKYKQYFKDEGYPWINTDTAELEWYVFKDRFVNVMKRIENVERILQQKPNRTNK